MSLVRRNDAAPAMEHADMSRDLETAQSRLKMYREMRDAKRVELMGAQLALGKDDERTRSCERMVAQYSEDVEVWGAAVVALTDARPPIVETVTVNAKPLRTGFAGLMSGR